MLRSGRLAGGPATKQLERLASDRFGRSTVACSSGTAGLILSLRALGIDSGEVITPALGFIATAHAIRAVGATPRFCDVDPETLCIGVKQLQAAANPRVSAVIPVDLFGQPADYRVLQPVADQYGLKVLADAAQSFGATLDGRRAGVWGDATSTSFFPAKPLGCYGDGGAIFTDDGELAALLRSLRVHGQGSNKYDNVRIGINGRLDTIQAAILIEKLAVFPGEIEARQTAADRYARMLGNTVEVPRLVEGATSVWAQYTIKVDHRDELQAACKAAGVPTAIYYPIPLSKQSGYQHYPAAPSGTPISEALSQRVLSLPMHPYLDEATQELVANAVRG